VAARAGEVQSRGLALSGLTTNWTSAPLVMASAGLIGAILWL
jgi:hypothetical protein